MNKKAAIATFLALGVSLIAFFIMKFVPVGQMPHRLFYDSVATTVDGGKKSSDTIWSKVPDFTFTNQLGQKVSLKDLKGKVIVADFFFTTCPVVCPQMTRNMKELQNAIKSSDRVGNREANFVHFISFTVDPARDSVAELKKYADKYQINPQNWWLLTGDKKEIYDLAYHGMKLGITEKEIDTAFIHPQQFVLIDRERIIRARKDEQGNPNLYNGRDTTDVKMLAEDIILLSVEKDRNKKFFLEGKLGLIAVVFGAAILGIVLLISYLNKEKKKA
ncbi:MAG TPA: SCO family protein [Flavisolibacter sp.]|nr:SCO family protein [Flavisolibacter sp.]